ncbi:EamA/RhaT family transporter [Paludibacter sp. 221]|uniref:DMT family transporter n=1 Tax=Paludibacter sp. 221 TaxID=2302939 RepID=UPI0013D28CBC|nr:DMT family transporter [Paludibacter sp. 221]NDV46576.1 EamA/RhaT family transporter [Paludibacter sp. 221]
MKNSKTPGHIALLVANVIFGFNTPISRSLIPDTLDPFVLTFFRMSGAMVLFWTVSLFTKKEHVPAKDIMLLFFASIFALVLNQMPFIAGLSMTSPIDASIVITLLPIVSMFLAAIIIKEPITLKKVLGVVIGASGALLLILNHASADTGGRSMWGNLIILGGVISYSLYLTLFKGLISRYSPVTLMKWMFLFATVLCLPVCYRSIAATDFASLPANVYLRIGYVVVFATFITYMLIPIGQKVLRPTTISMYNYVQPIVAALVAVALGLDTFGWDKVLSGVLVFTGVYFVTVSKSKAQLDAEKANKTIKGEK